MATIHSATFVTLYGQMGPPAVYVFVDFIILLDAIHGLIYTLRADSASRPRQVINIVYIFLAPTLLISDCFFLFNRDSLIMAKPILQYLVTFAQQIREVTETQYAVGKVNFRREAFLLRAFAIIQTIGVSLQYVGFLLPSNLHLVGFLTSRVGTCFGYVVVALSYFEALRKSDGYCHRMSDAFYTAWSALTVVAAVILLALGLAYLVQSISFDTLLLNQIELAIYSSSVLPVLNYKLVHLIDRVGERFERLTFVENGPRIF